VFLNEERRAQAQQHKPSSIAKRTAQTGPSLAFHRVCLFIKKTPVWFCCVTSPPSGPVRMGCLAPNYFSVGKNNIWTVPPVQKPGNKFFAHNTMPDPGFESTGFLFPPEKTLSLVFQN
jgi:hypothetical protein